MKTDANQHNKRKCNYERIQITLDMCHNKQYSSFIENDDKIANFKREIEKLSEKILTYENKSFENIDDEELNNYHSLCEKKRQKEEIINKINGVTEIDYLTKTSDILFEYYDIIEKQSSSKKSQNCTILDFFSNNAQILKESNSNNNNNNNSSNNISIDYSRNRAKLMDEYLSHTDNNFIDNNITSAQDVCEFCNSSNMSILLHEGIMYCNDCNTIEYIITDNDKPSYKEPPKEISYFSYKRINHFNESRFNSKFCFQIIYFKI